jgi:hypothetical protein
MEYSLKEKVAVVLKSSDLTFAEQAATIAAIEAVQQMLNNSEKTRRLFENQYGIFATCCLATED